MSDLKQCKVCEEFKPASKQYFYTQKNRDGSCGLAPTCKDCRREGQHAHNRQRRGYSTAGFIYFIQGKRTKLIKIGYTKDIGQRLASMQANSPDDLIVLGVVYGAKPQELELHIRFAQFRQHYEWFSPASEILQYISENAHKCLVNQYSNENGGLRYQCAIMERLL